MRFCRATSLDEALDARNEWGDDGQVLAGGTDLVVQYLHGEIAPPVLIHIEGIESLSNVTFDERTSIGALTSHRALATTPSLMERHPALTSASAKVGGWQTQVKGTIGGNICNASPAADTLPALLIADAHVTIASMAGERRLLLDDFLLGRRSTALGPNELLTSVEIEPLPPDSAEVYLKLGRRGAMDVAIVGLAMRLGFASDGSVEFARIATCAVGPRARRVPAAESAIVGSDLGEAALDEASEAITSNATPIDDARATANYRRRMLGRLLRQAVKQCQGAVRQ